MISAIVVNYYCHALTACSVKSVLADTPNAQVIVVDNSADKSEYHALCEILPARAKILKTQENIGFGGACNLAYTHAVHDWILLLNPDAYVLEHCVEQLVNFLLETPKAGAVAPRVYWDSAKTWLLPPSQLPTPLSELNMALAFRWGKYGEAVSDKFRRCALQWNLSKNAVKQKMLSGGLMLLRKSAIVESGGLFDPGFFMYYEDTDLCQRLQKNGHDLYLLPTAHAVHEWCATQAKNHLSEPSREYYFSKHYPCSLLLLWGRTIKRLFPQTPFTESQELGICSEPPLFTIPLHMKNRWVLELSPHPLFIPALYCLGNGEDYSIEQALWSRLGPGDYWARFSSDEGMGSQRYHWRVE